MPGLKHRVRFALTVLTGILLAVVLLHLLVYDAARIPARARTGMAMGRTRRAILEYARAHDRLPQTLHELVAWAKERHADVFVRDAWGAEIEYRASMNGTVTLVSYGSDGIPGGGFDRFVKSAELSQECARAPALAVRGRCSPDNVLAREPYKAMPSTAFSRLRVVMGSPCAGTCCSCALRLTA